MRTEKIHSNRCANQALEQNKKEKWIDDVRAKPSSLHLKYGPIVFVITIRLKDGKRNTNQTDKQCVEMMALFVVVLCSKKRKKQQRANQTFYVELHWMMLQSMQSPQQKITNDDDFICICINCVCVCVCLNLNLSLFPYLFITSTSQFSCNIRMKRMERKKHESAFNGE